MFSLTTAPHHETTDVGSEGRKEMKMCQLREQQRAPSKSSINIYTEYSFGAPFKLTLVDRCRVTGFKATQKAKPNKTH